MDFGTLPIFDVMAKRLRWLGQRQKVLAQNIANADTPDFKARDMKEVSFRELVGGGSAFKVQIAATRPNHIGPPRQAVDYKMETDKTAETSLNGNSVVLEDQMLRVSKTAMDHQLTVNLYRKHVAMLKAALGRPGG